MGDFPVGMIHVDVEDLANVLEFIQTIDGDVLEMNSVILFFNMETFAERRKEESKERFDVDKLLLKAIRKYLEPKSGSNLNVKRDDKAGYTKSAEQQLLCDVFLLGITTSKFKLADYTWSKLEDPIIASLAVSCALRSVAKKLPQREQKKHDSYAELSRDYEKKAISLVEIAYKRDAEKAGDMLQERHVAWREYNCLEVAIRGKAKDFLSEDCCHYKLRKMWFGAIDIKEKHWKVLIFSPIYWFIAGCVTLRFEEKFGKVKDEPKT
ncbi:transient receptor potential cation channel subfamily M member 2-like [Ptychodera flava]|uniref:transient receptor potential cation channel subfamily M member 2-like n=1 Tax=Ptychodera flava TaxID=63121 RepID=UPI003969BD1B